MNDGSEQRLSVLLTGATGFVGGYVAQRAVERGHRLRALVRKGDAAEELAKQGVEVVEGDITQPQSLEGAADGCEAVMHLVGIIREKPPVTTFDGVHTRGTIRVLEAAERAGVKKFLHMSALGARADGTAYQRTKFEAEEVVRRSGIPHVIFRPSIVVGSGGEFIELLLRILRALPVTPVIGDGRYRLQPVDVEDVATAFVQAAERDDLAGECFEIGGPHKLTYNRVLEIICEEYGLHRRRLHVPVGLVKPLVDIASNWRLPTPVTSDELAMMFEESIVPGEKNVLRDVFGLQPTSLRAVLQRLPKRRRWRRN
jgi:NADH dehydrogenase